MVAPKASRLSVGRRVGGRRALVFLLLTAVMLLTNPPAAAADQTAAVTCPTAPAAAAVIPDAPWPQSRFDLAAVGQVSQGAGVTVAVVDSGVDVAHPQLAGQVEPGADLLDRAGDGRTDCLGHGTAVASIIAARPLAGAGLRGLAPAARILAVRVSERIDTGEGVAGSGDLGQLVAGIEEAVRHHPQVINLSLSTGADDPRLRAAVQAALDADIVVVAAAGNGHGRGDPRPYPASYEGVVGVGAIGPGGERVPSSQVGSYVDIVAPGDAVVGAVPGSGHLTYQGTSFATPFVAATAALIRSRWPELHRDEVVRRLLATADPAAGARPSPDYGYGVVNPLRALTELVPPDQPLPGAPTAPIQPGQAAPSQRTGPSPWTLIATAALLLAAAVVTVLALSRRSRPHP